MHDLSLITIFTAGVLTFASPCILPLVPIHLSVLAGASVVDLKSGRRTARAVRAALAFSVGLGAVFVALGLAASAAGRSLLEHRALLLQLGGLIVFLFGLKLMGYLKIPWLEREGRPLLERLGGRGGLAGSFVFGAAFGLGWTPCIGPILGSVLTYTAASSSRPSIGALYLGTYAAGLAAPLVASAALAPLALHWHRRLMPHLKALEVTAGAVTAVVGLLLLTDHLGIVTPPLPAAATQSVQRAAVANIEPGPALALADSASALDGSACLSGTGGMSGHTACALPGATTSQALASGGDIDGPRGTRRLVEFVSPSCPICQRMEPILRAAESDCTGLGVHFVRVNVGAERGRQAADAYRVRGVPTFVFLDASGGEVARLVGEQPLATLLQSLEVLAGVKCDAFGALPLP